MSRKQKRYDPTTEYLCPPPDWRWQRAKKLVATKKNASTKRDDQATCDAARFLRAFDRYQTTNGLYKRGEREQDTMAALRIHQEAGQQKLELHCRLLAQQQLRAISRLMKLPIPVIKTYAELFFAVTDRINAQGYIVQFVIGLPPDKPPTWDMLMMMHAYFRGHHAVDAWLDYIQHARETHDLTTLEVQQRESIDLFIAIQQLPAEEFVNCRNLRPLAAAVAYPDKNGTWCSVSQTLGEVREEILAKLPWGATFNEAKVATPLAAEAATWPEASPIHQSA